MRDVTNDPRAGERGAISIKTLFTFIVIAVSGYLIIQLAPVYIEQRKVIHDVEELARIAAVRSWTEDKIVPEAKKLCGTYNLPDGSLSVVKRERDVHITVGYSKAIDLLVTTYDWKVDRTIIGKEL